MWRLALSLALITLQPGTGHEMRVHLPAQMPPDAHFIFRAYAGQLEILIDGQRVYRFDEKEASGHLRTHDVPLSASAAGKVQPPAKTDRRCSSWRSP